MPLGFLGITLISDTIAEFLFGAVFIGGLVNTVAAPLGGKFQEWLQSLTRGRNHDIENAMVMAFDCAVASIYKEWDAKYAAQVSDSERNAASIRQTALRRDARKILFGETGGLTDAAIRRLLTPVSDQLADIDAVAISAARQQVNARLCAQIDEYVRSQPTLQNLLHERLLEKLILYFREMFKENDRVFKALTIDGIQDVQAHIAAVQRSLQEMMQANLPETQQAAWQRIFEAGLDKYSEIWIAQATELQERLAELDAWKATVRPELKRIERTIMRGLRKVLTGVDEVKTEVQASAQDVKKLLVLTTETRELLRQEVESARQQERAASQYRAVTPPKFVGDRKDVHLFVGRADCLQQLAAEVRAQTTHLILITGMGGMGKTWLATKFCEQIEQAGYRLPAASPSETDLPVRGIVFIGQSDMATLTIDTLFAELAQILSAEEAQRLVPLLRDDRLSVALKTERLLACLRDDVTLLVLDNFETLLDETRIRDAAVQQFLEIVCSRTHRLTVMITSRANVALEALSGCGAPLVLKNGLEPTEGAAFLRQIGGRNPHSQIARAADAELTALSQAVHGIPLALNSLAGFLQAHSRLTLAALLQDAARFEAFRAHDAEKGLARLLQAQYEGLSAEACFALQVLAVYNAPVTPLAVRYLLPASEVETVLDDLAGSYFLAQHYPETDTFDLHPLVQTMAYAQIPDDDDDDQPWTKAALHARAADFYAEFQRPKEEWHDLPDVQPHLDEIEQRINAGEYNRAARIVEQIDFDYLQVWGYSQLVAELREGLLDRLTDEELIEDNYGGLARVYGDLGREKAAIPLYEQAIEIARKRADRKGEARWLGSLGAALRLLDEYDRAFECLTAALVIDREIGEKHYEERDVGNLGLVYYAKDEYERTKELYLQALALSREILYERGEGQNLDLLGSLYVQLGKIEQAMECFTQALAIVQKLHDRGRECSVLNSLGGLYEKLGRPEQSLECYTRALAIAQEIGDKFHETNSLLNLGWRSAAEGNFDQALAYYTQSLTIAHESGNRQGESRAMDALGNAYKSLGKLEMAEEYYFRSLIIDREIGNKSDEGFMLSRLGDLHEILGKQEQAMECQRQALAIAQEIGEKRLECSIYRSFGVTYCHSGEFEQALAYHQQVLAIDREIGDKLNEEGDLCNLGDVYVTMGNLAEGITYATQALAIAQAMGLKADASESLDNLGRAYRQLGDLERAKEYHTQSLALGREVGNKRLEALFAWNFGLVYAQSEDYARAAELMQLRVDYERRIGHPQAETHAEELASIGQHLDRKV